MDKQIIPYITPEMFRNLPDQTTEIINRLIAEVVDSRARLTEMTNAIIYLQKQVKNIQPGPTPTPGSWIQVLQFDPNNMGTTQGWCLKNTREGFGIETGTFGSAREDMESQMANGTLHSGYPPLNIAVPIYYNNHILEGHVAVWDHGVVFSDGVQYASINAVETGYMGWGELCDGTRVVSPAS